jgi:hypothetical protein
MYYGLVRCSKILRLQKMRPFIHPKLTWLLLFALLAIVSEGGSSEDEYDHIEALGGAVALKAVQGHYTGREMLLIWLPTIPLFIVAMLIFWMGSFK